MGGVVVVGREREKISREQWGFFGCLVFIFHFQKPLPLFYRAFSHLLIHSGKICKCVPAIKHHSKEEWGCFCFRALSSFAFSQISFYRIIMLFFFFLQLLLYSGKKICTIHSRQPHPPPNSPVLAPPPIMQHFLQSSISPAPQKTAFTLPDQSPLPFLLDSPSSPPLPYQTSSPPLKNPHTHNTHTNPPRLSGTDRRRRPRGPPPTHPKRKIPRCASLPPHGTGFPNEFPGFLLHRIWGPPPYI